MRELLGRDIISADGRLKAMNWQIETDVGTVEPKSVWDVMTEVDQRIRVGELSSLQSVPTGFEPLDHWISGGMKKGELILIGGVQGAGKTTFCLQIAKNVAASGMASALYACYEHDKAFLFGRLISQETIDPTSERPVGLKVRDIQAKILESQGGRPVGLREVLGGDARTRQALSRIDSYARRLFLL